MALAGLPATALLAKLLRPAAASRWLERWSTSDCRSASAAASATIAYARAHRITAAVQAYRTRLN